MYNIMKKLLLLLSVFVLVILMTFSVSAGNKTQTINGVKYTENKTTKIIDNVVYKLSADADKSKYDTSDIKDILKITEEVIYPEAYGDVLISESAFGNSTTLKKVTLPQKCGKITIEKAAFKNCKTLKAITFPKESGNITIGKAAFYLCFGLEELTFPQKCGKMTIGTQGFQASYIQTLTFPKKSGTINIGKYAFANCTKLTKIKNTDNIEKYSAFAFENCNSLTSVTISAKTKTIADFAFYECDSLKKVYVSGEKNAPKLYSASFARPHKNFEVIAKNKTAAQVWKTAFVKAGSEHVKVCYIQYA